MNMRIRRYFLNNNTEKVNDYILSKCPIDKQTTLIGAENMKESTSY